MALIDDYWSRRQLYQTCVEFSRHVREAARDRDPLHFISRAQFCYAVCRPGLSLSQHSSALDGRSYRRVRIRIGRRRHCRIEDRHHTVFRSSPFLSSHNRRRSGSFALVQQKLGRPAATRQSTISWTASFASFVFWSASSTVNTHPRGVFCEIPSLGGDIGVPQERCFESGPGLAHAHSNRASYRYQSGAPKSLSRRASHRHHRNHRSVELARSACCLIKGRKTRSSG